MPRLIALAAAVLLMILSLQAQTGTVKGWVVDEKTQKPVAPDTVSPVIVTPKHGGLGVRVHMVCPPKPCVWSETLDVQPGKFTLAGTVRDKVTMMPVPAAIVGIDYDYTDSNDVTIRDLCASVIADSLGRYVFWNQYPGTYHVSARCSFNAAERDTISFVTVADTVYCVDFTVGGQPRESRDP